MHSMLIHRPRQEQAYAVCRIGSGMNMHICSQRLTSKTDRKSLCMLSKRPRQLSALSSNFRLSQIGVVQTRGSYKTSVPESFLICLWKDQQSSTLIILSQRPLSRSHRGVCKPPSTLPIKKQITQRTHSQRQSEVTAST